MDQGESDGADIATVDIDHWAACMAGVWEWGMGKRESSYLAVKILIQVSVQRDGRVSVVDKRYPIFC